MVSSLAFDVTTTSNEERSLWLIIRSTCNIVRPFGTFTAVIVDRCELLWPHCVGVTKLQKSSNTHGFCLSTDMGVM